MKTKFRMFFRDGMFYSFDRDTGKRESLKSSNRNEAIRLLQAKNEGFEQPALNRQLAKTYWAASDPAGAKRTWEDALRALIDTKTGETQERWKRAANDPALTTLKMARLIDTQAVDFLAVLKQGTVTTNVFLRRLHNFALDLDWLPKPVLSRKNWPAIKYGQKRAITLEEHREIVVRERNLELRLYYELLWHLGGSQSDVAEMRAENLNWKSQTITYQRKKTGTKATLQFGQELCEILKRLPDHGFLFPRLAGMHEKHRAKEFRRRCDGLGICGVTLHSYRYSFAQRCALAGISERHAMMMLGHNSKAVHRAYSLVSEFTLALPVVLPVPCG